jgi:hypothetical protein
MPLNNSIFDLCAYYLLQYETAKKEKEIKSKTLKTLVEENLNGGNNNPNNENNKEVLGINIGIEKALKELNSQSYIPKNKIPFKSKELAITTFNIEIDQQKAILNSKGFSEDKIKLKSLKFIPERKLEKKIFSANNTQISVNNSFILNPTTPAKISYSETKFESFELEVDLLNHLSESGGINKLHYNILDKPNKGENINANIENVPNDGSEIQIKIQERTNS